MGFLDSNTEVVKQRGSVTVDYKERVRTKSGLTVTYDYVSAGDRKISVALVLTWSYE